MNSKEDAAKKLEAFLPGKLEKDKKYFCGFCKAQIVDGKVFFGLGKTWHFEHFTCTHCKCILSTSSFYNMNDLPYCEQDYQKLFAPKCAHCNEPIVGKCTTAMDKKWHAEHFMCTHCKNPFKNESFYSKDGKPYCHNDYIELFSERCKGCQKPIEKESIVIDNENWHKFCYVCTVCNKEIGTEKYYKIEGKPKCVNCFRKV